MKARLVLLLSILTSWSAIGQEFELFGGGNLTRFYDLVGDHYYNLNNYTPGTGAQAGFGFQQLRIGPVPIGLTFSLESTSGKFYTNNIGLGGGMETEAWVQSSSAHLAFYPYNTKLLNKHLEISLGWEGSIVILDNYIGWRRWWVRGGESGEKILESRMPEMTNKWNTGPIGRIGFCFRSAKGWEIVPQYKFYLSLTQRLKKLEEEVWYRQHLFELAIRKNLSSK